jgi:hypothetical protein
MAFDTSTYADRGPTAPDPDMLRTLMGDTEHPTMADCARLGRRFVQALLVCPKQTGQQADAAIRLALLLSAVLPDLESETVEDVWSALEGEPAHP